jgi:hypothetical protein
MLNNGTQVVKKLDRFHPDRETSLASFQQVTAKGNLEPILLFQGRWPAKGQV